MCVILRIVACPNVSYYNDPSYQKAGHIMIRTTDMHKKVTNALCHNRGLHKEGGINRFDNRQKRLW